MMMMRIHFTKFIFIFCVFFKCDKLRTRTSVNHVAIDMAQGKPYTVISIIKNIQISLRLLLNGCMEVTFCEKGDVYNHIRATELTMDNDDWER